MATIPPTPPHIATPRTTVACNTDCRGKRCAGDHRPRRRRTDRQGMTALMRTTEAPVQTR